MNSCLNAVNMQLILTSGNRHLLILFHYFLSLCKYFFQDYSQTFSDSTFMSLEITEFRH